MVKGSGLGVLGLSVRISNPERIMVNILYLDKHVFVH